MAAKKQQTHAKRARELAVKEKRERKQAKKAAYAAAGGAPEADNGSDVPAPKSTPRRPQRSGFGEHRSPRGRWCSPHRRALAAIPQEEWHGANEAKTDKLRHKSLQRRARAQGSSSATRLTGTP
jgi:hypothetical protein